MQKTKTTLALALTGILLSATAITPSMAQDVKTITGGFDVGPGGFPKNFNPLAATGGFTWLNTYLEPLVIYDAKLANIQGDLADEYAVSPDQKTYTFKLAKETWHDGEAFTSADVKFTLELVSNAATGSVFAARLSDIEGIETPDDQTVVVTLSKPNGSFLSTLTQVMMLPEHALASMDPASLATSQWWSTTPIGTGPFKFTKYVTDQYVELAKDEDYRRGAPKVDHLINRYFENPAAAISALRAGEIQFTYVEPEDAETFRGNADYNVIEGDSYVVNYVGFNHKAKIWDDLRVRQAFMYAIDRAAIVDSIYGGAAKTAQCGYVAPHIVPSDLNDYAYNPEKARELLAEAGWDKINGDKPINWLTYYGSAQAANVMAASQAMLAEVGINVVPRVVDTAAYNGIVYNDNNPDWSEFSLIYAGLQNGPNPTGINIGLNKSQIPPAGANIMRVEMDGLSSAFDAAIGETDSAALDGRWQDVCREMNENLPWGTMWVASRYGVSSSKLTDFVWTPAPAGGPFASNPEKWDIK